MTKPFAIKISRNKSRAAEYAALKRFICDHAPLSFEASLPAALRA